MSIGNVNIGDSQGLSLVSVKNPVAFQEGRIMLDPGAKDYQLRSRLDTLIKSGAISVEGDPQQFIRDVLEGVQEAREHGETSIALDDVALADFTQNDAVCAKKLGGNRPAGLDPHLQSVDKEAYAMIHKEEQPAEESGDEIMARIAKFLEPLKNLDIHI